MSFCIQWPQFAPDFIEHAKRELESSLNKGVKPSNIHDAIRVKELHMGGSAPELDILEIGELNEERFKGMFKIAYAGDAYVLLETKVQANPLVKSDRHVGWPGVLPPVVSMADSPLIVPLEIKISDFKIRGLFVLIVSWARGVTISFKNEPLESVLISSTFDNTPTIRKRLQVDIQQRLADLLREELPLMIHQTSLEQIKMIADLIPPNWRSTHNHPNYSHHRTRRSSRPAVSLSHKKDMISHGDLLDSSPLSPPTSSDDLYYFYRRGIIKRALSKDALCDPLISASSATNQYSQSHRMRDIFPTEAGLFHDLAFTLERLPFIGDWIEDYLADYLTPKVDTNQLGLTEVATWRLSSSSLTDESESSIDSHPRAYSAAAFSRFDEHGSATDFFDPDEFRSMDAIPISTSSERLHPFINGGRRHTISTAMDRPAPPLVSGDSWGRTVARTSLSNRLSILKTMHTNASPFEVADPSGLTIHRSQYSAKLTEEEEADSASAKAHLHRLRYRHSIR